MQLSNLISQLQEILEWQGDLDVYSTSNYGDYHRTEQLNNIADLRVGFPVESAYSGTGLAWDTEEADGDEDREGGLSPVLVLRYTDRD